MTQPDGVAAPAAGPTRRGILGLDRGLVIFLGLYFLVGVATGPISPLLPVYVERQLHQPPTLTSFVVSAQLLVGGLFGLVGGAVADGVGRRRALVLGLAGLPLAGLVFLSGQPWLMALLVGMRGATEGLQVAGSQAFLVVGAPAGRIGIATALFFLGNTLGSSLGSLVGGWLVQQLGFGALAVETVVLGVALTLLAATVLREPSRATIKRASATRIRDYASLVSRREVMLVAAVRFLPTIYWGTMTLLLPLLIYRLSQQVIVVSLYSAVSLLLAAACQIGTGRAVDRLSRTLPPLLLTAMIPVCAILAALSARNLAALFAVGVLGTCVAWSISATLPPLVREVTGAAEEGRVLGFFHLLWSVAMFGGTVLGGTLVEVDPSLPFVVVGVVNALTWLAALTLHRRSHGNSRQQTGLVEAGEAHDG